MAFEVGQIVEGKVTRIMGYGAFVDLGGGASGMVHISEVAATYVKEIRDYLTEEQQVKVKILSIDEKGKISLSIKAVDPKPQNGGGEGGRRNAGGNRRGGGNGRTRYTSGNPGSYEWGSDNRSGSDNFDDMLSRFMASSDEKISGMKKETRTRRKGGSGKN